MSEWYWENHPDYTSTALPPGYGGATAANFTRTSWYTLKPTHPMDVLARKVSELCAAACDLERELEATR